VKGRPRKSGNLTAYTTKLPEDQVAYLRELPNASEWLRDLIDACITAEMGKGDNTDAIAISRRLTTLNRQLAALVNADEYQRAKSCTRVTLDDYKMERETLIKIYDVTPEKIDREHDERLFFLPRYKKLILRHQHIINEAPVGGNPRKSLAGWTAETLQAYLYEHGLFCNGQVIPRDIALGIFDRMIAEYPIEEKLVGKYELQIKAITDEITALKQRNH
jgi:hypothetical protein